MVNRSAQGAIYDTKARRVVPNLLVAKYELLRTDNQNFIFIFFIYILYIIYNVYNIFYRILLLLPEIALNVLGTIWTYTNCIQCDNEHFTSTVVESKYNSLCVVNIDY